MTEPGSVMDTVQEFLGVSKYIKSENFVLNEERGMYCLNFNDSQAKKEIENEEQCFIAGTKGRTNEKHLEPQVNKKLHAFFKPFDDYLAKTVGHKPFDWNY